jgi:Kef-type K+ transport system membrane component KefB
MEHSGSLLYVIFIIFSGAAVLSTFSLFTRQSMLVSYIFLGVLIGPYCLGFINDAEVVMQVGEVGIMFLLFLLGLHLQPSSLVKLLKKVTRISIASSILFLIIGYSVSRAFGFGNAESIVIGAAMMFSSTIIGLKLLPTTILHHHHTGEMMIGILLMQDILAIIVLLGINGAKDGFLLKDIFTCSYGYCLFCRKIHFIPSS